MKIVHFMVLGLLGAILLYGSFALPPQGQPNTPSAEHVSPHYIARSLEETGTPNMVTAIIADYRSFDTLGETLVIFTAGLACLFLLGTRKKDTHAP